MEGSVKDLAKYRFEKAKEDLETAKMNHNNAMYKASINRSYYAIFHGMRNLQLSYKVLMDKNYRYHIRLITALQWTAEFPPLIIRRIRQSCLV